MTYLVEDPDPNGPFGAKEVGQGPLLPMLPAVANAVFDAVGVRVDEVPITPEKVLQGARRPRTGATARRRSPTSGSPSRCACRRPPRAATARARSSRRTARRPARRPAERGCPPMMRLPTFRYLAPERARRGGPRAGSREGPARLVVAGGTDLYPNMKRRHQTPTTRRRARRVARAARHRAGAPTARSRIGAGDDACARSSATPACARGYPALWPRPCARSPRRCCATWATLGGNVLPRHALQLLRPELRVAPGDRLLHEERRRHLLGGAGAAPRCWAVNSSDTVPVLIALGATARLVGAEGERSLPVAALFQNDGIDYLTKQTDEVLTHLTIPSQGRRPQRLPQGAPAWRLRLPRGRRGRARDARRRSGLGRRHRAQRGHQRAARGHRGPAVDPRASA